MYTSPKSPVKLGCSAFSQEFHRSWYPCCCPRRLLTAATNLSSYPKCGRMAESHRLLSETPTPGATAAAPTCCTVNWESAEQPKQALLRADCEEERKEFVPETCSLTLLTALKSQCISASVQRCLWGILYRLTVRGFSSKILSTAQRNWENLQRGRV